MPGSSRGRRGRAGCGQRNPNGAGPVPAHLGLAVFARPPMPGGPWSGEGLMTRERTWMFLEDRTF